METNKYIGSDSEKKTVCCVEINIQETLQIISHKSESVSLVNCPNSHIRETITYITPYELAQS